jgi:predicted RNA-binding Zn ribbon-like protein
MMVTSDQAKYEEVAMPERSLAADRSIGQAPGDLVILQAFVNTRDIEQSTDELISAAALTDWLAAVGLLDSPDAAEPDATRAAASQADFDLAVRLREAVRGVLRSHAGHQPAAGPAAELGSIAAGLDARLEVGPDGRVRSAAAGQGSRLALSRLLLIAAEAGTVGTWSRLKACGADDCQWAFYDRSPTRNGCWCSMQICGSRAKSRAYRQRAGQRGT